MAHRPATRALALCCFVLDLLFSLASENPALTFCTQVCLSAVVVAFVVVAFVVVAFVVVAATAAAVAVVVVVVGGGVGGVAKAA